METLLRGRRLSSSSMLQWGHGFSSMETNYRDMSLSYIPSRFNWTTAKSHGDHVYDGGLETPILASMGSQLNSYGDLHASDDPNRRNHASMGSRLFDRGEGGSAEGASVEDGVASIGPWIIIHG